MKDLTVSFLPELSLEDMFLIMYEQKDIMEGDELYGIPGTVHVCRDYGIYSLIMSDGSYTSFPKPLHMHLFNLMMEGYSVFGTSFNNRTYRDIVDRMTEYLSMEPIIIRKEYVVYRDVDFREYQSFIKMLEKDS